jgi:hypothetical protein
MLQAADTAERPISWSPGFADRGLSASRCTGAARLRGSPWELLARCRAQAAVPAIPPG